MHYPIRINTIDEYNVVSSLGFLPLMDWRRFTLDVDLRISIQRDLFGHSTLGPGNIPQANERFYKWCWNNAPVHVCSECMHPLSRFYAMFVSHILARGGFPEMAHDPRNHNILCGYCHQDWENPDRRKGMKIYKQNLIVIKLLKQDYARIESVHPYWQHG